MTDLTSTAVSRELESNPDALGLLYVECSQCGDFGWLAHNDEMPECSCYPGDGRLGCPCDADPRRPRAIRPDDWPAHYDCWKRGAK